jgi:hypothetical protein
MFHVQIGLIFSEIDLGVTDFSILHVVKLAQDKSHLSVQRRKLMGSMWLNNFEFEKI